MQESSRRRRGRSFRTYTQAMYAPNAGSQAGRSCRPIMQDNLNLAARVTRLTCTGHRLAFGGRHGCSHLRALPCRTKGLMAVLRSGALLDNAGRLYTCITSNLAGWLDDLLAELALSCSGCGRFVQQVTHSPREWCECVGTKSRPQARQPEAIKESLAVGWRPFSFIWNSMLHRQTSTTGNAPRHTWVEWFVLEVAVPSHQ
ncbi:hypothetical protein BDY17DRAFT_4328 [Neohortaea acidophila]|uniref:Uncharacterized protein n=1 Tax=Neohortaea acidophila TaxID=245834 RepID=A0A6A6Q690_9PEZI|nr:uncharacterized protein BDY17DRAFT_4328 [Neohortaea acidophila]KAF2487153.1 hypothetical protein BDY17DRAFT_4328 [Neohortaea acidophila]